VSDGGFLNSSARWLVGVALSGSERPLPAHRFVVLWIACRLFAVDLAFWRLAHGGRVDWVPPRSRGPRPGAASPDRGAGAKRTQ